MIRYFKIHEKSELANSLCKAFRFMQTLNARF